MSVRPANTQVSLGIRMPRLIWVFTGRTLILLVLSCRSWYPDDLNQSKYIVFTGYPNPNYEWRKAGNSQILQSTTSPVYRINSATLSDNGNYSCLPRNLMGHGSSATILVEVNCKLSSILSPCLAGVILLYPKNINSQPGSSVGCMFAWYPDGRRFDPPVWQNILS